ncbi:YcaO-like family protein [Pararhizobium sp. DWP3-4]|uniref:YcaO-like family protein n=1 Tax=Pararhizobium sp. DWP3-4 TaxID=2804565 RepID=UPI003CF5D601
MLDGSGRSDRACSPAETYKRVSSLLPGFGITRVARHTGLDHIGIPVWCAYTPNAKSIVVAQGKGLTDDEARTSAVMESLERIVAASPHVDRVDTSASALRRAGKRFHTLSCLIAAGRSLAHDEEPISWVVGTDLISGDHIHVPLDSVTLDRTRIDCRYWQSSDGLASGNTLGEAFFHGLNERIERDAYVLWQVSSARLRQSSRIDPRSVDQPELSSLTARIEAAGFVLRLFDMTSDIAVPSFNALIAPAEVLSARSPRFVEVNHGAGTHPSADRAMIRAITEAVQSRMTFISGGRDDIYPPIYSRPLPEETRNLLRSDPAVPFTPYRRDGGRPPAGDGGEILATLKRMELGPIIAVPLSAPAWPFAVAKILAPQLENPEGRRAQRFGPRALAKGSFG